MSGPDNDIIQAQPAPLSHLEQEQAAGAGRPDWRVAVLTVIVLACVGLAVWLPGRISKPVIADPAPAADTTPAQPRATAPQSAPAPFEQTQRQRAREAAQAALSAFVERQILLEDTMNVEGWGSAQLAQALDTAQSGDAQFLAERYDEALETYDEAAQMLLQVIELGNDTADELINAGRAAIDARDVQAAHDNLDRALAIRPEDQDAAALKKRASNLPEVISKLRDARNHELGGRWDQALAVYDEVQTLDPATQGLGALREGAAKRESGSEITRQISAGFAALDAGKFSAARGAFQQVLRLDPGNEIAQGGLQQVAQMHDLDRIRRLRSQGQAQLQQEQWADAIATFDQALQMDANLQFAISGSASAKSHQKAQRLLSTIAGAPQKLSSESLYLQAQSIVAEAQALPYAGAELTGLIEQVSELLTLYRDPVDVVLLSDNATDIIVSNVGRLGTFERKTLALRPGQYTIRGSQHGCRDIYLTVDILPGIEPLDLRCPDRLN